VLERSTHQCPHQRKIKIHDPLFSYIGANFIKIKVLPEKKFGGISINAGAITYLIIK
jgi:hypothetical protein